ncbi:PDDEXK nuclease domain-containing protein [Mogibacterium timidum]|uniref:PDDEXK nuclease domain-containing protein n=1 Tax=Mogibacterium timidum TaxID=35519 RepID=UPI0028D4C7BF|nr:PDDEXK nuclease domain-containing protein [Mogibacterium timidum]
MNEIIQYKKSNNLIDDVCHIIEDAQRFAYQAVNTALVLRNWYIGKRIDEEILSGKDRAKYGAEVIQKLAAELTNVYGKRYSKRILYQCLRVYRMFPSIVNEASAQLQNGGKVNELRSQFEILSWTHYRILTQVEDKTAREWYAKEAYTQAWSSTTLQRNISSQYYYRILKTQDKAGVENEMKKLTSQYQNKLEFIKNPVIAEFLGLQEDTSYYESDLEQCIIDNLQKFLIELGKGYAFVSRQQHIHTEKEDYYIDLVFYNYILKCFVLIDLKTKKITHQDVGQMDMYIRMYDELKKRPDDNPTLGIVLCADTDEDIAKYSVLHGNEQLFASKYKVYLPTDDELRAEIETQKEFFYLQKAEQEQN